MIDPSLFQLICFYAFAAVTVAAALAVVTLRNSVHAVLALVLTFFSTACIWMLAEAEFLAIALIVVYVGAVMVLFLFVVMMLDINTEELRVGFWKAFPLAALILTVGVIAAVALTLRHRPGTRKQQASEQVAVKASDRVRIIKMAAERPVDSQPAPAQESKP